MSDGLIPPFNAPPAGAAVPGIQPGTSGLDIAQIVIVFGPAGAVSGVFVYAPGDTPGPGTWPVAGMTQSAADPYGNPVPSPGVFVESDTGTGPYVLLSSNFESKLGLFLPTRRPMEDPSNGAPEIFSQVDGQGNANETLVAGFGGPQATPAIGGDSVAAFLQSSAADGSAFATMVLAYFSAAGTGYNLLNLTNTGVSLAAVSSLVGQQPSAAVPTGDGWHPMTMSTGFNITGNNFNSDPCYAEYTFEPIGPKGSVHIRGTINVTSGPTNAFKLLTGTALAAGYRPSQARYFPVAFSEMSIFTGSNNAGGMAVLESSGNIFVYGGATAATNLSFEATIRLD